jgi:hypothetical protein
MSFETESINIVPAEQTKTFTITGFRISVTRVVLFTSVSVNVLLLDSSNNIVSVKNLEYTGEQYQQWTNNDQTLINMVAESLGFTVQPGQGY